MAHMWKSEDSFEAEFSGDGTQVVSLGSESISLVCFSLLVFKVLIQVVFISCKVLYIFKLLCLVSDSFSPMTFFLVESLVSEEC